MNYDEMLTWLLFYRSIFDTEKTAMVDVIDPAGLIRSQAIENADGSLRITLNGAENRKTLAGHFISEGFGSGVQHIAFETGDIFETVKALKANGFTPLAISPNYYDDLDARFGLEEDFLEALKTSGILYDRDDNGEYLQLYSPTWGERLLLRDRRAPRRLQRLRCRQRPVPHRRPETPFQGQGHAGKVVLETVRSRRQPTRGVNPRRSFRS
jgi:4-hydroxyphenylpyruvate dioxygenase